MKLQTLKVTELEATILVGLIALHLRNLENNYQENKEDESFLKEEALSEITSLKALKAKTDKLIVSW